MDQNYYKYENEVNFNIDVIKDALKSILKANPVRFMHEEKDINDTLTQPLCTKGVQPFEG
jgi:hypothetical protein